MLFQQFQLGRGEFSGERKNSVTRVWRLHRPSPADDVGMWPPRLGSCSSSLALLTSQLRFVVIFVVVLSFLSSPMPA